MQLRQAESEARLAAGEHAQLVPELEQMLVEYPLDERIHGQLMLALYRCGRQADALTVYRRLRQSRSMTIWGSSPASSCATCRRPSSTRIRP